MKCATLTTPLSHRLGGEASIAHFMETTLSHFLTQLKKTSEPWKTKKMEVNKLQKEHLISPLCKMLHSVFAICVCIPIIVTTFPEGSAVRNHCRTHPALCVRPRCVCSVLRAHAQFCRFDKADATADVQWRCNHRPSRHSDTTIFQLRAHWVRISWSIGSEKSFGHVPPLGVEPSTSCVQGEHPIH